LEIFRCGQRNRKELDRSAGTTIGANPRHQLDFCLLRDILKLQM